METFHYKANQLQSIHQTTCHQANQLQSIHQTTYRQANQIQSVGPPDDLPPGDSVSEQPLEGVHDLEGLFAEEEDAPDGPSDARELEELDRLSREYNELVQEVGDKINYQVLRLAVPMRSKRAAEMNAGVRRLYLQIRESERKRCQLFDVTLIAQENFAMEGSELGCGIPTTGEEQSPQQNGRAEMTVKFVKTEARALLTAAKMPKTDWPLAMRCAVHRPRLRALGKAEDLLPSTCSHQDLRTSRQVRHR